MSDITDGQAACIAWNAHYAEEHGIEARNEWAASDPRGRGAWEAAAKAAQARLRERITALAEQVTASAKATEPSRKSQIEHEVAIALRKLLEDQ